MGILYYYIFLFLGFLISWIYIQDRLEIKEKLLIVGCGQLGFKIGNALSKNFDVTGIKRKNITDGVQFKIFELEILVNDLFKPYNPLILTILFMEQPQIIKARNPTKMPTLTDCLSLLRRQWLVAI